ncbi:hypothetical protein C6P46_004675 [Rhodotorula mucilaginosa]|uniref:Rho-GAP domain-containing protein n=1 Tax=Rhodotorula mucilaginosa TaxID=5537 RepID=A0A9P6W0C3_RHOMI|nr:hypothetical protein C6P46_004675 [Rhodotorula mucilaginosa]
MSQQKRRRDSTSSGTIRDWLPLVWTAWEDQEEGQDETEPLTDGDGERQAAHEDAAGDADSASMVVSECSTSEERQPMLVFSLCRVPDPAEVPSLRLLEALRLRLEETATRSGPYSVVLFLDPAPFVPSLRDLVSAYFALSTDAKKKVEHVYLVGGGWKTSLLVRIFSTSILSFKAMRKGKLVDCSTLSLLAERLGRETFRRIEIPLEVYISNAKRESSIHLDDEVATPSPAEDQAPLVQDCWRILAEQGPSSLGIFRRSPSATNVAHLEAAYSRGHPVRLDFAPDAPYLAASLLKRHLARMNEPVFSRAVCDEAKRCPLEEDDAAIAFIRESILPLLSPSNLTLLTNLVRVLAQIADNASQNLMTAENLVICICPALVGGIGGSVEEVGMCRVPGVMEMGTMRGLFREEEARSENTVGGVLKVMIQR